jgi:hypothetical protein
VGHLEFDPGVLFTIRLYVLVHGDLGVHRTWPQ